MKAHQAMMMFLLMLGMVAPLPVIASANDDVVRPEILVLYLSRTKNTKAIAEMIHKRVGGDLVALELASPYPDDFWEAVRRVHRENDLNTLPHLKTTFTDIRQYDTVFVGFPTWSMRLPPPFKTFFEQYDLSDIRVIPFNTHSGHGVGRGFEQVAELCTGCDVLNGLSILSGPDPEEQKFRITDQKEEEVESRVVNWLLRLGYHFD